MTQWKDAEREGAKIIGGKRYWASAGGPVDAESDEVVAQIKNVKTLSLHELERLAIEIRQIGLEREKVGLVLVRRKVGTGRTAQWLVVMAVDEPK